MDASLILDQGRRSVPMSWVDGLFVRMKILYGNRFLDMFANVDMDEVKAVWGQQMALLTKQELRRGADALMTREWPPLLPEFVKLCKLQIDPEAAYFEAVEQGIAREEGKPNQWSSPAIYWAWRSIGGYEFRSRPYASFKSRWSKVLADEVAKGDWPPIPEMTLQLGVDRKSTAMVERGVQQLSQSLNQFQSRQTDASADHRRWAREIIRKVKEGESVSLMATKMAQEALGLSHHQSVAM